MAKPWGWALAQGAVRFVARTMEALYGAAVPDPEGTLDDFIRVLKPGGELILVNHIGAESGPRRIFELAFAPLARRLGWRPEFPWARLTDWAAKHGGVSLAERRPMPPMGHFSLIRDRKS